MIYYFSATGNSQHVATRIAEKLGANAIVGVSFGYETMGQANSMIMISISGTTNNINA